MKEEKGFTLVETLVAVAILTAALLAAAAMSVTAYGNLHRSGEQTVAAELMQQHLEWLRNQSYASVELAAGTTTTSLGGDYLGYTRTTRVRDDTPASGIKEVAVIMSTPSGRSTRVTALVTE